MITIRAFYPKQSAICMDLKPSTESNTENEIDEQKKLKMCSDITLALLYLLQTNQSYKELIYNNLYKDISSEKNIILNIKMTESKYKLDSRGNDMNSILLWEYIELEDALHWLSTLGGAFSNLGEHDKIFAKRAGENAAKQLIVAQKFGDKQVIAKCWLFVAMSLMQQEYYENAQKIVRHVYAHCRDKSMKNLAGTGKLVAMCRGIWARLKYEANKNAPNANNDKDNFEIEFKFSPPDDIVQKLENLGAKKLETKSMVDIYIDRENFELIKKDHWLRYRNKIIELKMPSAINQHSIESTIYKEITNPEEISNCLGHEIPTAVDNLTDGWIILAKIETSRQIWIWKNFTIVLDSLPDGFKVSLLFLAYGQWCIFCTRFIFPPKIRKMFSVPTLFFNNFFYPYPTFF